MPPEKQQQQQQDNDATPTTGSKHFAFESYDESMRRFRGLPERKNVRYESSPAQPKIDEIPQPIDIPIERINPPSKPPEVPINRQAHREQETSSARSRDRKYRSKTLEGNQLRAVDNQIYGCSPAATISKGRTESQHRGELHKHRSQRLSFRRSTDDVRGRHTHLRKHFDSTYDTSEGAWMEIGQDHWTNLLEHGWRPTTDTTGVTFVSFTDAGRTRGVCFPSRALTLR